MADSPNVLPHRHSVGFAFDPNNLGNAEGISTIVYS